ncbi:MAG: hypothetical protein M3O01_12735 [Pseudomonadota bacterium]|nr:hypothetical protein [Pseudomonadota bacterium]
MTRPAHRSPVDPARLRALFFGAALGCVAWALSTGPNVGSYQLAMALVVIAAGSASFVAFALHARRATVRQAGAALRVWICALGSGVCLAILGMQWVAG